MNLPFKKNIYLMWTVSSSAHSRNITTHENPKTIKLGL